MRKRWGTTQNFILAFTDKLEKQTFKKSPPFEEGGTHLRISAWHLLMNLKNNYSLKKLLKWAKKCKKIITFTMLYFLKKIKKTLADIIILHLRMKNLMI